MKMLTTLSINTVIALSAVFLSLSINAQSGDANRIDSSLQNSQRSAEDKARDAGRKPAEVLAFLGLTPGMTVMDVMASGGWYTEVLSFAIGDNGKVYAQNTPAFLQFRDGMYEKAISERLKDNRLANVERLDADFNALKKENEIDLAISALNFHDIYHRSPEAAVSMLKNIKDALKPGGVFGLIDHNGSANADNAQLHRMTKQQAIAAATQAGFVVTESDLLANPNDDHSKNVFGADMRGNTDRFLLKLTKPKQ